MPSAALTAEQIRFMKDFLPEFRDAPKRSKAGVVKRALAALFKDMNKNATITKTQKKQIRKVDSQYIFYKFLH